MEIDKDKAISNIKDEYAAHCTEIVQSLIDHLAYSVADIQSWNELTDAEKKIMPKEVFEKLTFTEDKEKHSMIKEDKELLFKDLCAKLPYSVL